MLNLEQQIFKQIEKAKNILIIFPSTHDGDATASALALFIFLKNKNYTVELVASNPKGKELLSFLPDYSSIQRSLKNIRRFIVSLNISKTKVSQIKYSVDKHQLNFIVSPEKGWFENKDVSTRTSDFKYDLIITIGTNALESLGQIHDSHIEFFYKTPVINIDNQSANEDFGQINFVDLNAVANAEIMFYLLKNYSSSEITEDVATCLLAEIINKTKNFKTTKLTPRTLLTTSELINLQARREEIIDHLYRSRNLAVLKLWGKVLSSLKSENKNQLLWSKINLTDFKESKADEETLLDIIDELISSVPSAKIITLFLEKTKQSTRMLIYSPKNLNVLELSSKYNSQGNIKIAHADLPQNIEKACAEVIPFLKSELERLPS